MNPDEAREEFQTPYENHKKSGHPTTEYSPNGIDIIEECTIPECGARFLWQSGRDYPLTLLPHYPPLDSLQPSRDLPIIDGHKYQP
mgnify:CR=1 FL=1